MKTLHVHLGERSYDILIASRLLEGISPLFDKYGVGRRLFVVSNTTVFQLYGQDLLKQLSQGGFEVTEILIPDGEKYKNLETVDNIYTYLIAQRADRYSVLVALGGGVTGDIVGFAAATFLRGIPYVQMPTTLVSQVDSSVGGKTGVNHHRGKNMIGAFYQPHLVCIDIDTLETLPDREFQSGLYEVVKYGLIYDAEFFRYVVDHLDDIRSRVPEVLETIISRCCEIKAEITSLDEKESDLRRILNFGHTFGHALEAATSFYGLTHGEAVAYGMLAAVRLSEAKGLLDDSTCREIVRCIQGIGDLPSLEHVPTERVLEAMERDKKRRDGRTVWVLLKGIGKTVMESDIRDNLAELWDQVLQEPAP